MDFGWINNCKVDVNFNERHVTSDGGMLLLRKTDNKLGLIKKISNVIKDHRIECKCKHQIESIIKQRVFGIAHVYEGLNDHNLLRNDPLIQTAVGTDKNLASDSTISRFERSLDRKTLFKINEIFVEIFIKSYKKSSKEIILDFYGTDDKVHGNQIGEMFHGYYNHKCFLPLYVFCGNHLLVVYLQPENVPDSKHCLVILKLLVKKNKNSLAKC